MFSRLQEGWSHQCWLILPLGHQWKVLFLWLVVPGALQEVQLHVHYYSATHWHSQAAVLVELFVVIIFFGDVIQVVEEHTLSNLADYMLMSDTLKLYMCIVLKEVTCLWLNFIQILIKNFARQISLKFVMLKVLALQPCFLGNFLKISKWTPLLRYTFPRQTWVTHWTRLNLTCFSVLRETLP